MARFLTCHEAEAPRVLCWLNTEVSTPARAISILIQRAKDRATTALWGFVRETNTVVALACRSCEVLAM